MEVREVCQRQRVRTWKEIEVKTVSRLGIPVALNVGIPADTELEIMAEKGETVPRIYLVAIGSGKIAKIVPGIKVFKEGLTSKEGVIVPIDSLVLVS